MATYTNIGQGRLICSDKGGNTVRFERNKPTEAEIDETLPGIAAWLRTGVLTKTATPAADPSAEAAAAAAAAKAAQEAGDKEAAEKAAKEAAEAAAAADKAKK